MREQDIKHNRARPCAVLATAIAMHVLASVGCNDDSAAVLIDGGVEAGGGADGAAVFRGFIALDSMGKPIPALRRAMLVNGNVWPPQDCCEGVTLDDFVFGTP